MVARFDAKNKVNITNAHESRVIVDRESLAARDIETAVPLGSKRSTDTSINHVHNLYHQIRYRRQRSGHDTLDSRTQVRTIRQPKAADLRRLSGPPRGTFDEPHGIIQTMLPMKRHNDDATNIDPKHIKTMSVITSYGSSPKIPARIQKVRVLDWPSEGMRVLSRQHLVSLHSMCIGLCKSCEERDQDKVKELTKARKVCVKMGDHPSALLCYFTCGCTGLPDSLSVAGVTEYVKLADSTEMWLVVHAARREFMFDEWYWYMKKNQI